MINEVHKRVPEGQRIVVVGLGGVGSIVARYGATFFASLDRSCRLVLVDGDSFEARNAARMIFRESGPKAVVVGDEIAERVGAQLIVDTRHEYVTTGNVELLIRPGDIVFSCVDNHATRKLIGSYCEWGVKGDILLISGGNDGIEEKQRGTYGTVQIYYRRDGKTFTPAIEEYHPEIRDPKDKSPAEREANCTEMLGSVPQILFANLQVASLMLSAAATVLSGEHHYSEAVFDIVEAKMTTVDLPGTQKERGGK